MVNIMTLFLFPLYMALAVLPVALIGWIISNKAHNSEPGWMLVLLFILGCISCVPAFIGELFFQYVFGSEPEDFILLFIYIFFGIAFVEETVKWFCCYIVGFNNKAFDKAYDMIIYAVFATLGFAFIEDILYIITSETALAVAIMRAIISIPAHACFAIIMGYFLGLVRYYANIKDRPKEVLYTLVSILLPTLVHAIFDTLLFAGNLISIALFFAFVIIVNILCFTNAHKLYKRNIDV